MSNVLTLTKVLIKNNVFAFSGRKKNGRSVSAKGGAFGFALIMVMSIVCMGAPTIYALDLILKEYNLSEFILTFAIPVGGITALIFGSFSIMNIFYFNKDSEKLLHLPIKSSELLMAKFFASLISEYFILLMFILPIILGVGIGSDVGIVYYIYSLGIAILMPIIPSVIISIILMIFNKIFHFGKKKDIFMYVATGIILCFSFAYSFGLEFILDGEEEALLTLINGDLSSYMKLGKLLFPFFNSATYSLVHYNEFIGLASFITFVGMNLLFLVILYFIGDKLYIKGLTTYSGNETSKKKSLTKIYKKNHGGVMSSLILHEWKTIKRTPVFMLNVVVANVIFPLIIACSFVVAYFESGKDVIDELLMMINIENGGILLIATSALLVLSSLCGASSSAISREGKNARFMKTVPVDLKTQLDAKVYFSMIVESIVLFVVVGILVFVIGLPWYYGAMLVVLAMLAMLVNNYINILIDLRHPRIDWVEESEAVKQNLNILWGMLVSFAIFVLFALIGIGVYSRGVNIFLIFIVASVILLTIYLIMGYLINKYKNKLFDKVG